MHEEFMAEEERKMVLIRTAALRFILGLEPRSLREVAQEIGCKHQAIDNATERICKSLKIEKFHYKSQEARKRLSDARRRFEEAKATHLANANAQIIRA